MESAGPMTRSRAKALGKPATPLADTTNAGAKSTRRTGRNKLEKESAPAQESPVRRTALLDDFNKAEEVDIAPAPPAAEEEAPAIVAQTPVANTFQPKDVQESAGDNYSPVGSTIAAIPSAPTPAPTPASPISAMSFGHGLLNGNGTKDTPELFTGIKFEFPNESPNLAAMLQTPGEALQTTPTDAPSLPQDSFHIPSLSPISIAANFFSTPASAADVQMDTHEEQAPQTLPVDTQNDPITFFQSPVPLSPETVLDSPDPELASAARSDKWMPSSQVTFQPTPMCALTPDAASPFVTMRTPVNKVPLEQASEPAVPEIPTEKAVEEQMADISDVIIIQEDESAMMEADVPQQEEDTEPALDMVVETAPAITPLAPAAGKAASKCAKTVAFDTPAAAAALDKSRTPLMSQLSGAGHTPWAKPATTPPAASKRTGAAPPVPKFTPAAATKPAPSAPTATRPISTAATKAVKTAATSARPVSPGPAAASRGSWSFLRPTAASQAKKAAAAGAAVAEKKAAAVEKPRIKSVVVVPENSGADARSLISMRKEYKALLEAKATKKTTDVSATQVLKAQAAEEAKEAQLKVRAEALKEKSAKERELVVQQRSQHCSEETHEDVYEYSDEEECEEYWEGDEEEETVYDQDAEDVLVQAMQGLGLKKLRGLPTPTGKHTRFNDQGEALPMSPLDTNADGIKLHGLPTPAGKHIRFDDDGEAVMDSPVAVQQGVSGGLMKLAGLPTPQGTHVKFDD